MKSSMQSRAIISTVFLLFSNMIFGQQLTMTKLQESFDDTAAYNIKDSLNKLVVQYNELKSPNNLNKIVQFLGAPEVRKDTTFLKAISILITQVDSATNTPGVPLAMIGDDVKSNAVGKEKDSGQCAKLKKIEFITIRVNEDDAYEVAFLDKSEDPISTYPIMQLNETLFYDEMKKAMLALCTAEPSRTDTTKVDGLIAYTKRRSMYEHMIEARVTVNDEDVLAAALTIHKKMEVWITTEASDGGSSYRPKTGLFTASLEQPEKGKSNIQKTPDPFTVHEIQIQFQDGFIENIIVRGKIPRNNNLLKFSNNFPIPISTKRDFRKLYETYLFELTIFHNESKNNLGIKRMSLRLGDLLDFNEKLEEASKDYSPANQVIDLKIAQEKTIINLLKERTSKILELKIFTDLKGISGDEPNGLVQFELSKKLNLLTYRYMFFWNWFNFGFFNYFTPSFTMSKIENDRKRLPVQYIGSREPDTVRANTYASILQLLQYQTFRVGADVSVLTIDVPGLKSTFTAKAGLYFGRTLLVDTIRTRFDSLRFNPIPDNNVRESGINSFQYIPELCFQVFPDKRYSVILSYKLNKYQMKSDEVELVNDTAAYTTYIRNLKGNRTGITSFEAKKWIGTAEIFAYYRPSTYSQLFFRYRFNYDRSAHNYNFHQLQLGFSTYLTHTKKSKKEAEKDK